MLRVRRRNRPQRRVGDEMLVAGSSDGTAVRLNAVATLIWESLAEWQDRQQLVAVLARHFPAVGHADRSDAIGEALALLDQEELLEHAER